MAGRGFVPAYAAGSDGAAFGEFCRDHLVQSVDRWDGLPLRLEAWQSRLMGEALAFDRDGLPCWNSVVIVLPRKNGKTMLLAAYAVFRLLTSEGTPEILLAASSDKQAGRLFDACASFIRRNEVLAGLVRVRDHAGELRREDGFGVIYRLSSDPARLHGYNPSEVIVDELHAWTTPTLRRAYAALTSAGGARRTPRTFTITTAGEAATRHDSLLGRILDAAEASAEAERKPGLMVARMTEARTLVFNHEAPTRDPRDVKAMKLANPASWITLKYLRRQAENPELSTADVLQLHGCVWASAETTFVPPLEWAGRAVRRRLEDDEKIVVGFDGSERRDATALIACTLDGFVSVLNVWQRPAGAAEEWRIPRREVHDAVDGAFERYEVLELACDPPGWYSEIDEWTERHGAVVAFETKQGQRMAPACERFRAGVLDGSLTHDGSQVLAAHVGNCVATDTPWGTRVRKDHPDSPRKIDAAVAAVIAYDRACWHATNETTIPPLIAWA